MGTPDDGRVAKALRRAAVRATHAPSVHNTQPWRFVLRGSSLEIHADRSRQLRVLDPRGRQLMTSCGCALFNARVALAAAGLVTEVQRLPDPTRPALVARVACDGSPIAPEGVEAHIAHLDPSIDTRQTNRRRFSEAVVPQQVISLLRESARAEGAELVAVQRDEHRRALARLSRLADRTENADPSYRAELRQWTGADPGRLDGVPAFAVPHVAGHSGDEIPIRDFDTHGMGWLPDHTHSTAAQCLVLIGTDEDGPAAWLRCGEALERVLLEVTRAGYAASPLTQVIEVPQTHAALRAELGLSMQPHVLLRVGRAPITPATRRRRLVDVIVDEPD